MIKKGKKTDIEEKSCSLEKKKKEQVFNRNYLNGFGPKAKVMI